ncbi:hypothetical protein EMCG_07220, partial [[Emmonsia] crescens]
MDLEGSGTSDPGNVTILKLRQEETASRVRQYVGALGYLLGTRAPHTAYTPTRYSAMQK